MSLEKARKLLGPKYDALDDTQVENLIKLLDSFAKLLIDNYINSKKRNQE